jgi:hypothetical protein
MNIEQLKQKMADLVTEMQGKGVKTPRAQVAITDSGEDYVHIGCHYNQKIFGGSDYAIIHGDTLPEAISAAFAFVASMPSPEDAVKHEYLTRVASAIDYATENALPEEYVAPLRGVSTAMTENLLTHRKAGAA